ncbi:MAG: sensor histidine kinase [Micromonosporaceae bacterium]
MVGRADRPRWTPALLLDVALGVSVALVVAAAITVNVDGQRRPDLIAYLFAAGLGALMLVRRQFPVLALVATAVGLVTYYIVGYPAIGLAIPVAAALYSAAEAGRQYVALAVAAGLVLISTVFRVAEGDSIAFLLGYELSATVGLMGAAIAIGDGARSRRLWRAGKAERLRESELAREREAVRRVEAERLRIARELHDVLAHTVSVVTLHADVAAEALPDDLDEAGKAVQQIRTVSGDAMRELRTTVNLLRAPAEQSELAPVGGLAQLDRLVAATTDSGLPTTVRTEGEPTPLPGVVDATAYRIVQESLTNALRHSQANRVDVVVRYTDDTLVVRVDDDGRGSTAPPRPDGSGIAGMRERVALLGGSVHAGNREAGGFTVEASLPLVVAG